MGFTQRLLSGGAWALEAEAWKVAAVVGSFTSACFGAGLCYRQHLLRSHPVFMAAEQQCTQATAVHEFLGGAAVSTRGIAGGYVDVANCTAILTMPVTVEGGRAGHARGSKAAAWHSRRSSDAARLEVRPLHVPQPKCAHPRSAHQAAQGLLRDL